MMPIRVVDMSELVTVQQTSKKKKNMSVTNTLRSPSGKQGYKYNCFRFYKKKKTFVTWNAAAKQ